MGSETDLQLSQTGAQSQDEVGQFKANNESSPSCPYRTLRRGYSLILSATDFENSDLEAGGFLTVFQSHQFYTGPFSEHGGEHLHVILS